MATGSNDDSFRWCFLCFFRFDEEWDSYAIGAFVDVSQTPVRVNSKVGVGAHFGGCSGDKRGIILKIRQLDVICKNRRDDQAWKNIRFVSLFRFRLFEFKRQFIIMCSDREYTEYYINLLLFTLTKMNIVFIIIHVYLVVASWTVAFINVMNKNTLNIMISITNNSR